MNPTPFAVQTGESSLLSTLAMSPLDWGITLAAIVMLIYAARTLVSGKGKSQIGLSFAVLASIIWTTAIGRHIDGFSFLDGIRVGFGVLLLVPVFRVMFSHTGGSATGAVISILLASVIAGPVASRYITAVTSEKSPEVERLKLDVEDLETRIQETSATRDSVAGFAATERAKLEDLGIKSQEEIEANPEAMVILEQFAGYRTELNRISAEIMALRDEKVELEAALRALEQGGENSAMAQSEAERIRERVKAAAERDKTVLETYTERGKMLELFEKEFGAASKPD